MRASWEALRAGLENSARTPRAIDSFTALRRQHLALARFDNPLSLVDYLANKGGDVDEKDRLLAALVTMVQGREHQQLASALLWLGLWPGLSAIFVRRIRNFEREPEELLAELACAFTELVERSDVARIHRVAATLVRSTERDVICSKKRAWAEESHGLEGMLNETPCDVDGDDFSPSCVDMTSLHQWAASGQELPSLSFDEAASKLRIWLESLVGGDAELLLSVLVLEETQRETARRLGLSHDAARKRFQRALVRLRLHLAKPLSPRTGADGFVHLCAHESHEGANQYD